ncbi:sigma-70 family RNA polymerase sigma factor [Temperatibacter marinus]|uniref:RNA polymerase sigma factor n=1 Tax=Temperatibacter marinus TaxID=1456591 RepID=A0AA52HA75_9PROT|nr:sigma-70 family RNA polymerase sigma factor [Temperatibacter marinus]WND03684.1 sigma-70 family RNA polymerase sigma factor [Temperatibacter marinus]
MKGLIMSADQLIISVQNGCESAFRMLVDQYGQKAVAIALRMTGNRALADDIAQQVFMKIWQYPDRYDPEKAKFSTWFYRVVTNQTLDEIKKKKPLQLPDDFDQIEQKPSAEEGLMTKDQQVLIKQTLESMPDRQKTVMTLTYFEDLSNAEVAQVMEISVKAVESLLVRSRKLLREKLSSRMEQRPVKERA